MDYKRQLLTLLCFDSGMMHARDSVGLDPRAVVLVLASGFLVKNSD